MTQFLPEYRAVVERDRLAPRTPWQPGDAALPALYLGHGAPPLLQNEAWLKELHEWAVRLPTPRAIVVVSAHWEATPLMLSASAAGTKLVYDFGGFDPRFNQLTYATPDASALSKQLLAAVSSQHPVQHPSRGLDHGAWVPLMAMYPDASVPVVQLSLPGQDPATLLRVGELLRPLRAEGVLIVGSGFLTHGLPFLAREHFTHPQTATAPGWSAEFDAWAAEALARGDVEALSAFATRAPGMPYAHPTPEHFTPLLVAMGAGTELGVAPHTEVEGFFFGLSKRSVEFA